MHKFYCVLCDEEIGNPHWPADARIKIMEFHLELKHPDYSLSTDGEVVQKNVTVE